MNIKQLFKTKDRFYDWPLCVHIYIYISWIKYAQTRMRNHSPKYVCTLSSHFFLPFSKKLNSLGHVTRNYQHLALYFRWANKVSI